MFDLFKILFFSLTLLATQISLAETEAELIEKAKSEGTLVVLTNHLPYNDVLLNEFKKKYPMIKVERKTWEAYGFSHWPYFKTENEKERTDVVFGCQSYEILQNPNDPWYADLTSLENWPKRPEHFTNTPYFIYLVASPHVIVYNSKKVKESDLPGTYEDLLNPKWKNKVVYRNPLSGSSPAFISHYINQTRGNLDWFAKLGQNKAIVVKEFADLVKLLNSGKATLGLTRDAEIIDVLKKNKKLKMHWLKELPFQYQLATMNARVVRKSAAKLLLNWVMVDGQETLVKAGFTAGARREELLKKPNLFRMDFEKVMAHEHKDIINTAMDKLRQNGATVYSK